MNNDMLVKLYDLPDISQHLAKVESLGYKIVRAHPCDKSIVLDFIRSNFDEGWVNECDHAFSRQNVACFIAIHDKKVVGFACYDATNINFFGPTGVDENHRHKNLGTVLLLKCLYAMRDNGFAYGIIGWVDSAKAFYQKTVGAITIEDSFPGIYSRLINL